ncbi:MAG: tripartite tricarboxylate transporter substrate binding protein [Herminiimonas sp.]|nr:tripartite tricarboxylate transporter substrate binding protein [Herminiimonas sp.]
MTAINSRVRLAALMLAFHVGAAAAAGSPECIAPARPKGGFDLTCELIRAGLRHTQPSIGPLRSSYMPGGVGAITYNAIISQRNAEPNTFVAFSGGSLFSIAQGKFGRYTEKDVRWLAALGTDYGVLIVNQDSPFKSLKDLALALKKQPNKIVFGGSGTIGSQDWMKAALVADASGAGHKAMRFVGFEGGGEANTALQHGHVDVVSGDASEAIGLMRAGAPLRVLTVFSGKRLPGILKDVATAGEDGYDIEWQNIRGVYMGPQVAEADYQRWVAVFNKMLVQPEFIRLREEQGLLPFARTGAALEAYVHDMVDEYKRMAIQSRLLIKSP